jgi:CHASE2 domain-containing sensor protein
MRWVNAARRLSQRFGWGRLLGLAVLAGALALRAWDPMPLQLARLKTFDFYQLAKARLATVRPVVIVDIDEGEPNQPRPVALAAFAARQIGRSDYRGGGGGNRLRRCVP